MLLTGRATAGRHRYMRVEGMAELIPPTIDGEATLLLSAQITPQAA